MDEQIGGFDMQAGSGPKPGIYTGRFLGVKKTHSEEWGGGAKFEWEITKAPPNLADEVGKIASRTSKPVATATNITGTMIASLIGPVPVGQRADLSSAIGREYTVVVAKSPKSENTRVESILPLQ